MSQKVFSQMADGNRPNGLKSGQVARIVVGNKATCRSGGSVCQCGGGGTKHRYCTDAKHDLYIHVEGISTRESREYAWIKHVVSQT